MYNPVVIYNPNRTNSYALEVAAVLTNSGRQVEVYCPVDLISDAPEGIAVRRVLAGERGSAREWKRAVQRLLRPLQVAWKSRRHVLVVAWTKDPWDAFVMRVRSMLGARVVVAYHNPRAVRGGGGATRAEVRLLRNAVPVVHSNWLKSLVVADLPRVRVASHPPYTHMAALATGIEPIARRVAFVGALRADKGADLLPAIAAASSGGWVLRFIGAGEVPTELADKVRAAGVIIENRPDEYRPNDEGLARAVAECEALLAPYGAVTTSGSMLLAVSLGRRVITLDSPAVRETVPTAIRAKGIAEIGSAIDSLDGSHAAGPGLEEWVKRARKEWGDVVDG